MLIREALYRKLNSGLEVLAVTIAIGSLLGSLTVLKINDLHTEEILSKRLAQTQARVAELNEAMRQASLKLGFNLLILPRDQNLRDLHAEDYATRYMPEEYVTKLADSGIVTVRHFLPGLRQKLEWPEVKRTIILVGTRGEVPNLHKNPVKPLVQPVPEGTIVLGYELHQSLGIEQGETVDLMGRTFKVHKLHAERGSKDDITAWISLREAQKLLDKEGLINSILALKCLCAVKMDMSELRESISDILPGTHTVEMGTRAVARAEARLKVRKKSIAMMEAEKKGRDQLKSQRERLATLLVPLIMSACAVWIGYLGFVNVKERDLEVGVLRALGYRSSQILLLFLSKSLLIGLTGGGLGCMLGFLFGHQLAGLLEVGENFSVKSAEVFSPVWLAIALPASVILTVVAGWLPALVAAQQDPARVLKKE